MPTASKAKEETAKEESAKAIGLIERFMCIGVPLGEFLSQSALAEQLINVGIAIAVERELDFRERFCSTAIQKSRSKNQDPKIKIQKSNGIEYCLGTQLDRIN